MKNLISSSLVLLLLAGSGAVLAGEHQGGMNHAVMPGAQGNGSAMHQAEGIVNSIDMEQGKINMTHGPVKSLRWPGMTMDFKVKDSAILKDVKPGQKVKFEIEKEGDSQFSITRIVPLK